MDGSPKKLTVRDKLIGGAGLLFVVLWGAAQCVPDDPDSFFQTGLPSHIAASIDDFHSALAGLIPGTMTRKVTDGRLHYQWAFVSTSNGASFFDDGADGTIDQVLASVCLPSTDVDGLTLGFGFAHALVKAASGESVDGPAFVEWVKQSLPQENARRRFGSVTVDLSLIGARDGALLILGIGEAPKSR
jgi:hypothetical protein